MQRFAECSGGTQAGAPAPRRAREKEGFLEALGFKCSQCGPGQWAGDLTHLDSESADMLPVGFMQEVWPMGKTGLRRKVYQLLNTYSVLGTVVS